MERPSQLPESPHFGSGPCKKRPGYSLAALEKTCLLGRSHRSKEGKARLQDALEKTRRVLALPAEYHVGIVPASDTGAMEMAMWNLLGPCGVDVFYWDAFGKSWAHDIVNELKLEANVHAAAYGELPDFAALDPDRDAVFTWNGTTSGVRLPDDTFTGTPRGRGLRICDATSAVFAYDLPWSDLDVVTFSWQKVLGGEAQHGVLIMSPRAVDRLASYRPVWPIPKVFQLRKSSGEPIMDVYQGSTINTPSMLCVEDYIDALDWVVSIGGYEAVIARCRENFGIVEEFVDEQPWIHFLAKQKIDATDDQVDCMTKKLAAENVAVDIASYRDAPKGIRIWCGATVEPSDLRRLLPWLSWAYHSAVEQ